MIDPSDLSCVDFTQSDTIRLISTAYIDEPAMRPLADDDDELSFLEEIEGLTFARQASGIPLPSGLHPTELLTERDGYGWTYVNAAFCYTRSSGNRFNGPERGAWYAAWGEGAADTALAEVSWHLTRELEGNGRFDNITRYRELIAGFVSRLYDLRGHEGIDALAADPLLPTRRDRRSPKQSCRTMATASYIPPRVKASGFVSSRFVHGLFKTSGRAIRGIELGQ